MEQGGKFGGYCICSIRNPVINEVCELYRQSTVGEKKKANQELTAAPTLPKADLKQGARDSELAPIEGV